MRNIMEIKELNQLIKNKKILDKKIKFYETRKIIKKQESNILEIKGHLEKVKHNLQFVNDNLGKGYNDWCITGCYYSMYHSALALALSKGYFSKNHDATLCILIKEFYNKGVNEEDLELFNKLFIDYMDLIIYVEAKIKREEATYSTNYNFTKEIVEDLRNKAVQFTNKVQEILNRL